MTKKIKSLCYLSCFILSGILYNATVYQNTDNFSDDVELSKSDMVDTIFEDQKAKDKKDN